MVYQVFRFLNLMNLKASCVPICPKFTIFAHMKLNLIRLIYILTSLNALYIYHSPRISNVNCLKIRLILVSLTRIKSFQLYFQYYIAFKCVTILV